MADDNGLWADAQGNKAAPDAKRVLGRSVIAEPPGQPSTTPTADTALIWVMATAADGITPWGRLPKKRDLELRAFWPSENMFASALGIVAARNAAFSWNVEGPPRVAARMHDILTGANMGEGWHDLIVKLSIDLYTQDNGAFLEVVRETDSPASPVIGLNHLDAYRCWHTGFVEYPVIYQDQHSRFHLLPWYNVLTLAEMPAPVDGRPGQQFCALTRLMRACQIIRNVSVYKEEKTGGRYHGAIHLIKGVTTDEINDALARQRSYADAQGALRYVAPLMVGSIDPKADVGHDTIEMATLPDGWNEADTFKHYVTQIAMAFLSDYQEFAPLPGGGLGTSTQSEILHLKSRGKGPGLFMKLITHALNFKVLPKGVEFFFDEADLEAEQQEAQLRKTRAETYKLYYDTTMLDAPALRQLALDAGDIPQEVFEQLGGTDVTTQTTTPDEEVPTTAETPPTGAPPITDEETTKAAGSSDHSEYDPSGALSGRSMRQIGELLGTVKVRRVIERDDAGRMVAIVEEPVTEPAGETA